MNQTIDFKELDGRIRHRERLSLFLNSGAVLLSIAILTATIGYSWRTISTTRLELKDLERQKKEYVDNIRRLSGVVAEAQGTGKLSELAPIASATPIPGERSAGLQAFDFRIRLLAPKAVALQIRAVTYIFDHPTFKDKEVEAAGEESDFFATYRGWGCLSRVGVRIRFKDESSETFYFNQCDALRWPKLIGFGRGRSGGTLQPGLGQNFLS